MRSVSYQAATTRAAKNRADRAGGGVRSRGVRQGELHLARSLGLRKTAPRANRTKVNAMPANKVEPPTSRKTRSGKIAAYVAGGVICVLALLVVAERNMKPENPVARIRDECQKSHGNLGPTRVSECLSELVMRMYARGSNLP